MSDPFDARSVAAAPEPLRAFNVAGVLEAADVHVALRLAELARTAEPAAVLAAALAVRAPRLGHVYVDLATVRSTAVVEDEEGDDAAELPWPPEAEWAGRLAQSGLAAVGEDDAERRPLRLIGTRLYLDRYWREERRLAADLRAFADADPLPVDEPTLAAGLLRLFGAEPPAAELSDGPAPLFGAAPPGAERPGPARVVDELQRRAAETAVRRRFAVIAGGPGTGKTTTLARVVALLVEQAAAVGEPPPLVALAAPTGKAAARLAEAVHEAARTLPVDVAVREQLLALGASTLHRLLGSRPGTHSRYRHHRGNRLPHDVVVVDETSMVSLPQMARLVEAVRAQARLILVGDPGQLASIEAGAVLGDIVGPAGAASPRPAAAPAPGAGPAAAPAPGAGRAAARGIVVLERVHRFGEGIAALAEAVREGDADGVLAVLARGPEDVTWIATDPAAVEPPAAIRERAVAAARAVIDAAQAGDGATALEALGGFRLLCAHRLGAYGVATWIARIEAWLAAALPGFGARGRWYPGRPLLVTENDYGLQLFNGDTGVVVAAADGGVSAAFERRGELITVPPTRLAAVETVYAMTIHKSQGSQYDTAAILLPPPTSRVLTRELLYTAVTRARRRLILAGTEEAIRAAVARPVARASGLGERLWGA